MSRVIVSKGNPNVALSREPGTIVSASALYVGDDTNAWVQLHDIDSQSVLQFLGIAVADETVTIGAQVYTWKASTTTVAGEVKVGATVAACASNLAAAVVLGAGAGTEYGSLTVVNAKATATVGSNNVSVVVLAKTTAGGDAVAVATTETMTNAAFSAAACPILTDQDVPQATVKVTRGRRGEDLFVDEVCTNGVVIAFSSTENTWTAIADLTRVEVEVDYEESVGGVLADNLVFSYDFDGVLTEVNGGRTLASSGGTLQYGSAPPEKGGRSYKTNSNYLTHAAHDQALRLTAAMSISFWVRFTANPNKVFLSFSMTGGAEADNSLFSVTYATAGNFVWTQTNGAASASTDTADPIFPLDEWLHVTYTRPLLATSVKQYINGVLTDTSAAIVAPTGGTVSTLVVGADVARTGVSACQVSKLKIWDAELTAAQVLSNYRTDAGL